MCANICVQNRESVENDGIDAKNKKWAKLQVIEILCDAINTALQNEHIAVPISQNVFPLVPMPKLADVSFADAKMPQEEYKQKLDELQKKLNTNEDMIAALIHQG